jgi:hypothetical protein
LEAIITGTFESTVSIDAVSIFITVVHVQSAFIDIETSVTVTGEPSVAGTIEGSLGVGTSGIKVAIISTDFAFVNFAALNTVTEETALALAAEGSDVINTMSIWGANIVSGETFVNVRARVSVALESSNTVAEESFVGIDTSCVDITSVGSISALIGIGGGSGGSGSCSGGGSGLGSGNSSGSWFSSWSYWWFNGGGWFWSFRESPDEIETVEISSLIGFELDHDQVRVENLSLEPSVFNDVVKHGVRLVIVVIEEIRVVWCTGDTVLDSEFLESIDVLTHFG